MILQLNRRFVANVVSIPEHFDSIITKMDNADVLDTLRDYELNLPQLEGKENASSGMN